MRRWLGCDLRSLALFRVAVGLILLIDLFFRSVHFRAHYTSEGILPLKFYLSQPDLSFRYWSIFYINDSPLFVGILLLLAAAAAVCLTVGYRTRLSGWLCWVFWLGLHHRNPLIVHKGDSYLLLLLFWGCLLPWGRRFSVDAAAQAPRENQRAHLSLACAGYLLQVCYLYWFSAVYRTGPTWAVDGSALYYTLHLESDLTWFAPWMLPLEPVLKFLSFATILFEAFGPFLLLLPFAWSRILSVLLIVSFHFGIMAVMNLGLFAWICIAGPLGLLPALVWETTPGRRLEKWLTELSQGLARQWPKPIEHHPRRVSFDGLAALALAGISYYSFSDLAGRNMHSVEMNLIRVAGLNQRWGMFSPSPPLSFGWPAGPAMTLSGEKVDLVNHSGILDQRWRFYRSNIERFDQHGRNYLDYLVKRWDQKHPQNPIVEAQYLTHTRAVLPDYQLGLAEDVVHAEYRR